MGYFFKKNYIIRLIRYKRGSQVRYEKLSSFYRESIYSIIRDILHLILLNSTREKIESRYLLLEI
jgi:hypothetical protein